MIYVKDALASIGKWFRRLTLWDIGLWLATALAGALLLFFVQRARPDGPAFLLQPVAQLTGAFCGLSYTHLAGQGYAAMSFSSLLAILDTACCAAPFMVVLALLLVITQAPRLPDPHRKLGLALFSWAAAIDLGLVVAALRATIAIATQPPEKPLTPLLMNNSAGLDIQLTALVVILALAHLLIGWFVKKATAA